MRTVLEFKRFCHDAGLAEHFVVSSSGFTVTLRPRGEPAFGQFWEGEAKTLPEACELAVEQYLKSKPKETLS